MQLITFLSAATAMIATASARTAVTLNKECDTTQPHARIINRCDYPVYLWSVLKGTGCPDDGMVTLKKGEIYNENFDRPKDDVGVSIKVSKTKQCAGKDIVQLEYFIEKRPGNEDWWGNYLDVSYVDCLNGDCPTKNEGYYLKAGNQTGVAKASADNTRCPILSCHDAASCAKMSYILPDDTQTKTCDLDSNMDFYMCGGEAPSEDGGETPANDGNDSAPTSSAPAYSAPAYSEAASSEVASSAPAPSNPDSSAPAPTSTYVDDGYKAKAADVTPTPVAEVVAEGGDPVKKIKTEIVYVTAIEYVNAKRHAHAHDHVRRHQPFRA